MIVVVIVIIIIIIIIIISGSSSSSGGTIVVIKIIKQSRLLIKNIFSHPFLTSLAMCSWRHCDVIACFVNDWPLLLWTRPFPISLVDVLNILTLIGWKRRAPIG